MRRSHADRVAALGVSVVLLHLVGTIVFVPYLFVALLFAVQAAVVVPVALLLLRGLRRRGRIGVACGALLAAVLAIEAALHGSAAVPEGGDPFGLLHALYAAYGLVAAVASASALALAAAARSDGDELA